MKIILFIIYIFLLSCNKKDNGWKVFNIKEGNHKSSSSLEFTNKNIWNFKFQFDSTCIYKTNDPINQWDVNKLIGISDGSLHLKNSARFGWRWLDGKLELLAYTHYQGNFEFKMITDIEIGKEYTATIQYGNEYTFICNNKIVTMRRDRNISSNNYYLWPYFGGDEKAPHNIKIKINY